MEKAPHAERVAGLVEALGTPVVQVWGWPGSGRGAVLDALLERLGPRARGVAPAEIGDATRCAELVAEARERGERWLICHSLPAGPAAAEGVGAWSQELPAGARLVVATSSRLEMPGVECGLVTPRDLSLSQDEVESLWGAVAGEAPAPGRAEAMAEATDGWYRPLLLAAALGGRGGSEGGLGPEALVALGPVADFLRLEVLAGLSDAERAALSEPERAGAGTISRLRDTLGLLLDDGDGLRAPRLVSALLDRERVGAAGTVAAVPGPSPPAADPVRSPGPAGPPGPLGSPRPDAEATGACVRLRLLGRPEAWRRGPDGGWIRLHWPLKRSFRALAYLATSPDRRAAREELVEALWPEESDETIRRNFHPTLSHLRRGLRAEPGAPGSDLPPLLLEDDVYRLNPELGWWIDVEEVARQAERAALEAESGRDEAATAAWEAGWRLYRGDLLEGFYDRWLADRREDLRRGHLALLRGLGSAYERRGSLAEATDAYRAALVEDPLQERLHAALMRLYSQRGRRDLVRRQYERLSALLREELGVEPLAETTDEYHRLMMERG